MTETAKDLIGKCARRVVQDPYVYGEMIIKDVSPYGHVQIERHVDRTLTESEWLDNKYFNNWERCKDEPWSRLSGKQLVGKCVTRISDMKGDRQYINEAIHVYDVDTKGKIRTNPNDYGSGWDPKWNDGNWVLAPPSMKCTKF